MKIFDQFLISRADANLQLQCTLEVYEMPNDEQMIKVIRSSL